MIEVVDQICKLAKKGATPSQIGVILRDSHGIAQVKVVTGGWMILEHACEHGSSHGVLTTVRRKQDSPHPEVERYDMKSSATLNILHTFLPTSCLSSRCPRQDVSHRVMPTELAHA